jgi:hypothetical protein
MGKYLRHACAPHCGHPETMRRGESGFWCTPWLGVDAEMKTLYYVLFGLSTLAELVFLHCFIRRYMETIRK